MIRSAVAEGSSSGNPWRIRRIPSLGPSLPRLTAAATCTFTQQPFLNHAPITQPTLTHHPSCRIQERFRHNRPTSAIPQIRQHRAAWPWLVHQLPRPSRYFLHHPRREGDFQAPGNGASRFSSIVVPIPSPARRRGRGRFRRDSDLQQVLPERDGDGLGPVRSAYFGEGGANVLFLDGEADSEHLGNLLV